MPTIVYSAVLYFQGLWQSFEVIIHTFAIHSGDAIVVCLCT